MADSLEYILACQICLEDFEESGDKVPRILPCHHTLCERCLKRLIEDDFIECPECRKKHRVVNNERTFPQNKYILANVRRKQTATPKDEREARIERCEEHRKELAFYCKGPECQKAICQTCLTRHHRGHDFDEIEEKEKEAVIAKIEIATKDLQRKQEKVSIAEKEARRKNKTCIEKLKAKKEEHIRIVSQRYDELIEEITKDTEELTTIEEHLELLNNIKENINDNDIVTLEELTSDLETVTSIMESAACHVAKTAKYNIFEYQETDVTAEGLEMLFGRLRRDEKVVKLTDTRDASDYKCTVIQSISTDLTVVQSVCPLDGRYVALFAAKNGSVILIKHDITNGRRPSSVTLSDDAKRITEVRLAGKQCLAVSYCHEQRIEFRDANNLTQVVLNHSVAPDQPWELCTSSHHTLMYEDLTGNKVKHLDCNTSPPTCTGKSLTINYNVYDMCCVQHDDKQLLITSQEGRAIRAYCQRGGAIRAYCISTNTLLWSVKRELPEIEKPMSFVRVTTDSHGHIYVCDSNNSCTQMFSAEGRYLGAVLREGEQGLGAPRRICWCNKSASLIVVHEKNEKMSISVIKVE